MFLKNAENFFRVQIAIQLNYSKKHVFLDYRKQNSCKVSQLEKYRDFEKRPRGAYNTDIRCLSLRHIYIPSCF